MMHQEPPFHNTGPHPAHPHAPDERSKAHAGELPLLKRHKGLLRLDAWIAEHGAQGLTLELAAQLACLSPRHFSATFHKHTGLTFQAWRQRIRIGWAVRAIQTRRFSIGEIVHLCGYRDRRAFERAVRRMTGSTPGAISRSSGSADLTDTV